MNEMDSIVKKVIGIIIVALILAVAIYGSYLPLRKAQIFIATLQGLQTRPVTSLKELEARLSPPLDYPSPIGQEELVRNMANSVLGFVQRGSDATSTAMLIDFLSGYYDPIIARGRGMSFGQDVYLLGAINEIAFARTGGRTYLVAARKYYEQGRQLGPDRPQPLYGLFDVYRAMGDPSDAVAIANKILANWPGDHVVGQALAQFLAATKSAPPSKSIK